jgi:hypothetical protein
MGKFVVPLLKPGTVEAAKVYIGTTLKKWWEATETSEAGWYKARILAAYDDIVNEVTGELEEGLQLTLRWVSRTFLQLHRRTLHIIPCPKLLECPGIINAYICHRLFAMFATKNLSELLLSPQPCSFATSSCCSSPQ